MPRPFEIRRRDLEQVVQPTVSCVARQAYRRHVVYVWVGSVVLVCLVGLGVLFERDALRLLENEKGRVSWYGAVGVCGLVTRRSQADSSRKSSLFEADGQSARLEDPEPLCEEKWRRCSGLWDMADKRSGRLR